MKIEDAIHTLLLWILKRPEKASPLRTRILDDLTDLQGEIRAEQEARS